MRPFHILQYLMTDRLSLQAYRNGNNLTIRELSFNLYEQMHLACSGVPEQYIADNKESWLWVEEKGKNADQLRDVFTVLLPRLTDEYLKEDNGFLYLKSTKVNDWQLMVQLLSPLLLVCSFVHDKYPVNFRVQGNEFVRDLIMANTQNTVLPCISQDMLDSYGCDSILDMHFHLNASMEADRALLNLIKKPRKVLTGKKGLSDLILKACGYVDRNEVDTDVCRLCKLEYIMAECVFGGNAISMQAIKDCLTSRDFQYNRSVNLSTSYLQNGLEISDLQFEALLIHRVLYQLTKSSGGELSALTQAFHSYLLLYGRLRSFAVMQQGDSGLLGFNRYLSFGARDADSITEDLPKQLIGNKSNHLDYLDVRMGYNPESIVKLKRAEEAMSAHFTKIVHVFLISKESDKELSSIRNEKLRKSLSDRALPTLLKDDVRSFYSAVDVAGRDYEVHPDVFAQCFDKLREAGYTQFTYHAGEDFYHILGGMRAIFEAVHFLKLNRGCRIGHACALGVAPHLWSDMLGGEIRLKRGEYLDDLIFTLSFIHNHRVSIPKKNIDLIKSRIKELAQDVYGRICSLQDLTAAWEMRKENPNDYIYKSSLNSIEQLLYDYHKHRDNYEDLITVSCYEVLNESHIVRIQRAILSYIASKEIAIETMPTSNVYIGFHQSFHSYHLKQWIDWKFCKRYKINMPAIVIGSDEPGILCTNIMTEYANIFNMLKSAKDMQLSAKKIPTVLKKLADDAKQYEFN